MNKTIEIRAGLEADYADVYSAEAIAALQAVAGFDQEIKDVMRARIDRRRARARDGERIAFLDPASTIARTNINVQDARDGNFEGSEVPHDLECRHAGMFGKHLSGWLTNA